MMKRLAASMALLLVLLLIASYATESWIFAFAPASVDQLAVIYSSTNERVELTREQASLVLRELREAKPAGVVPNPALPEDSFQGTHVLLAQNGQSLRLFPISLPNSWVADQNLEQVRWLGEGTQDLLLSLKPSLPGKQDVMVPPSTLSAGTQPIGFTRFILPVAYGSADFRVYKQPSFLSVPGTDQVLVLAAWGQQPGAGYSIRIEQVAIQENWLRITVTYRAPEPDSQTGQGPSFPADAVLINRNALADLRGAFFVDQDGDIFASQALGYPVERKLFPWEKEGLPQELDETMSVIAWPVFEGSLVQTLVVVQSNGKLQPEILGIIEVAQGVFEVKVGEKEGDSRYDAALIHGWGSGWSFTRRR